jgi:hypothetical protein
MNCACAAIWQAKTPRGLLGSPGLRHSRPRAASRVNSQPCLHHALPSLDAHQTPPGTEEHHIKTSSQPGHGAGMSGMMTGGHHHDTTGAG